MQNSQAVISRNHLLAFMTFGLLSLVSCGCHVKDPGPRLSGTWYGRVTQTKVFDAEGQSYQALQLIPERGPTFKHDTSLTEYKPILIDAKRRLYSELPPPGSKVAVKGTLGYFGPISPSGERVCRAAEDGITREFAILSDNPPKILRE